MKSWQLALKALDRPRSLLELSCAMATSRMVAATAVNLLMRHGGAIQTGELYSRTPRGADYMADMDPQDHVSAMGHDRANVDELVAHAIATQPTSVFDLTREPGSPRSPA